ncbi:MAG: DUF3467 domain-containing protein [Planctomycetaceae bacterium]|nr:DUF3467 domain-containing protein [Planctomycetaceae bacterium]
MNDDPQSDLPENVPVPAGNTYHQEVQHSPATARIPDAVGRGVFSTGAIVMHGAHDFVIDFVQSLAAPRRVVARVALPPTVVPLFVAALQENLRKYNQNFGPVPRMPPPPPGALPNTAPPPITDVYEQLKLPDDMLSGVYANTVVISHSPAEFCFDFVTSFYPRSAVSGRVYVATPHVPELLESLTRALQQFQQKQQQLRPPQPPQPPPE